MDTIKHILVPSDFSQHAEQAALHAMAVASRFGAKITFLHIVTVYDNDPNAPQDFFPDIENFYKQLETRADEKFQQTIATYVQQGLQTERVIQRGFSPYEEILTYAEEHAVDLIAMGTHGRKSFAHFLMGSVTEKIVHHAACPVLCTHIDEQEPQPIKPYERILVPVDFSEQSKRALRAAKLLLAENGRLDLLHVIEDHIHPAYYTSETHSLLEFLPNLHERAESSIQRMVQDYASDIKTEITIADGHIAKAITNFVPEHNSDLIVMGTHGLNALEQIFIGSVANKVIRKASCPVMTVK
ncbi:MAG: universal stress protein [candidate division KSB1 bacterium]|nr:universal stress protein [candidate division KSB1 bacterium]